MEFGGNFTAAMSLGQSPLATSGGVGSSGWAVLQRCQDIISEDDCDGGYDNAGVQKGLVFKMIVTLSLSTFLSSTLLCFPYLRVGGEAFGGFVVFGTPSEG